jgi:uncharacterized protein (TIGR03382 family)
MLKQLALALGVLLVPLSAHADSQSIVGGQTANPADFPAVVALEESPGNWFCTGTLIADKWVLTAAHCVDGADASGVSIRLGDPDVNDDAGGTVVAVAAVHSHPGFDWEAWDNDIALLELAAPVTDRAPTPILREEVAFGTEVVDVGYGVSDNNDGGGGILRKVSKVTADCGGAGDEGVSNANLVCMDAADGAGSCFGDSGGPTYVTVNGKLVVAGVTSGGTGELCGDGWDLYTSVSAEIDFIDETMGNVVDPTDPDPTDPDPTDPDPVDPEPTNPDPIDTDPTEPVGGGADTDDGGCSTSGSSSALVGFALLGLVATRRRRK